MDEKNLTELKDVVEHASHGNWIPFGIVVALLGLVFILFLYILRMKERANDKKHLDNDVLLAELTKGNIAMNTMIAVHETKIHNLERNG